MAEGKWDGKSGLELKLNDEEVEVFTWAVKMWGFPPIIAYFNAWLDGRRKLKAATLQSDLMAAYIALDSDTQAKVRDILGVTDGS